MDAMRDTDLYLLMAAAVLATLAFIVTILGKSFILSLGRVNMKKKYRFHQVIGGDAFGEIMGISPTVLAETNRFRDVEKLRDTILCERVALVYEPEVKHAAQR